MKNRKLSCKQLKILAVVSVLFLIVVNGFVLQGVPQGVLFRTVIELIIFLWLVTYSYCKRLKK